MNSTTNQQHVTIHQLSIIHKLLIYIYHEHAIHHQQLNYHQIHLLKHITKTRARISTIKFTIITYLK